MWEEDHRFSWMLSYLIHSVLYSVASATSSGIRCDAMHIMLHSSPPLHTHTHTHIDTSVASTEDVCMHWIWQQPRECMP